MNRIETESNFNSRSIFTKLSAKSFTHRIALQPSTWGLTDSIYIYLFTQERKENTETKSLNTKISWAALSKTEQSEFLWINLYVPTIEFYRKPRGGMIDF